MIMGVILPVEILEERDQDQDRKSPVTWAGTPHQALWANLFLKGPLDAS
jgi:hypothetical protein